MGLFGSKPKPQTDILFETNYMGFWIKVYPTRVDFKAGAGSESVPLNQISSIHSAMMGLMKVTLETTGGKKYNIPTNKKKEVQQAIYEAQSRLNGSNLQSSSADEIAKLSDLKEKGVITQEEFDQKKKQLLGI